MALINVVKTKLINPTENCLVNVFSVRIFLSPELSGQTYCMTY